MAAGGVRVVFVSWTLITQWTLAEDLLSPGAGLATYSTLLMAYLASEIWQYKRWTQAPVMVTPPVLTSITTFIIPFAASNILFLLPEQALAAVGFSDVVTPWMNDLMLLVFVGSWAMWVGYGSRVGRGLAKRLNTSSTLRQLISHSTCVNRPMLCACLATDLAVRLLQFHLGAYGYSASRDRLISLADYREYLSLLSSLGTWALIAVALEHFRPRTSGKRDHTLWLLLGYQIAWGFLAAFKNRVLVPVLLVAVCHYIQRGRIPLWFAPAVVGVLLAAYTVIEPYRASWNQGLIRGDLPGVATAMLGTAMSNSPTGPEASAPLQLLARANLTYAASLGIEFAATGALPPGSPAFLNNILWAPVYAFVPRVLWHSKPFQEDGLWYTRQVTAKDNLSATAMSAITYLNFAGGAVAVMFGFWLVGVTQRALFDGLRVFGAGGWLVILGLLPTLVSFEGSFDAYPIYVLRLLPLLITAQRLLFVQDDRRGAFAPLETP